jgi:DNA-binding GntR family transcriptional regulator
MRAAATMSVPPPAENTVRSAGDGAYKPLAAFVAERLREDILSLELRPGERIRQEAIAKQCGTSRIPVREALRILESEGLVTLTSHVGARVAHLDIAELEEVYLIRERLEPMALRESVPHLSDEQLAGLDANLEAMEACAHPDTRAQWVGLDRTFHLATYAAAPLPRMLDIIENLWNATQQYRRAYTRLPQTMVMANQEHRLILAAIVRRDAEDAEALSAMHIRRTRRALGEHTELFSGERAGAVPRRLPSRR